MYKAIKYSLKLTQFKQEIYKNSQLKLKADLDLINKIAQIKMLCNAQLNDHGIT